MHALAALSVDQYAFLIVTAASAIGAAVVSIITVVRTAQVHKELQPPSNHISNGAMAENTALALHLLTQMVADNLGKQVSLPTPRQTQEQAPGATITDPPPAPTDVKA